MHNRNIQNGSMENGTYSKSKMLAEIRIKTYFCKQNY